MALFSSSTMLWSYWPVHRKRPLCIGPSASAPFILQSKKVNRPSVFYCLCTGCFSYDQWQRWTPDVCSGLSCPQTHGHVEKGQNSPCNLPPTPASLFSFLCHPLTPPHPASPHLTLVLQLSLPLWMDHCFCWFLSVYAENYLFGPQKNYSSRSPQNATKPALNIIVLA